MNKLILHCFHFSMCQKGLANDLIMLESGYYSAFTQNTLNWIFFLVSIKEILDSFLSPFLRRGWETFAEVPALGVCSLPEVFIKCRVSATGFYSSRTHASPSRLRDINVPHHEDSSLTLRDAQLQTWWGEMVRLCLKLPRNDGAVADSIDCVEVPQLHLDRVTRLLFKSQM